MAGGTYYGLTRSPGDMGSGGGNSSAGTGGTGGAFVTLNVAGDMEVDGMYVAA